MVILAAIFSRDVDNNPGTVPALKPFEKTAVELASGNLFEGGVSYRFTVRIEPEGQRPATLEGSMAPNP